MKQFRHLGRINSCSLKEGGAVIFLCLSEGCEEREVVARNKEFLRCCGFNCSSERKPVCCSVITVLSAEANC